MSTAPKPFYYQVADTIIGPVTGIELRDAALAGNVVTATLVANDPNGEWASANRVRGLFDFHRTLLPHPPETSRFYESRKRASAREGGK